MLHKISENIFLLIKKAIKYKIKKHSPIVFSIGYEGRDINNFIDELKKVKIKTLVDVRETPYSRKKDFSKSRLREHLERANIRYYHIRELGSPKKLRDKFRRDSNFVYFAKRYQEYLDARRYLIKSLDQLLYKERICFMCFEKDYLRCHRNLVIEKIREIDNNGLIANHI